MTGWVDLEKMDLQYNLVPRAKAGPVGTGASVSTKGQTMKDMTFDHGLRGIHTNCNCSLCKEACDKEYNKVYTGYIRVKGMAINNEAFRQVLEHIGEFKYINKVDIISTHKGDYL